MRLMSLCVALAFSIPAFAADPTIYLRSTGVVSLSTETPVLSLAVSYPGPSISGICGIEVRATSRGYAADVSVLFAALDFPTDLGVPVSARILNRSTIAVDFGQDQTYGVWFSVKTKNGNSLKSEIARTIGPDPLVTIVTATCR